VAGQGAADGTPFGRYRLVELLGRGGMGEVWRAHDTGTDRVVAIKVLPAYLSQDEEFQRRFRREAHAAARLDTPHVVPIHDYGEIDGRLFVCMRLIKGRDLQAVLADGPIEPARAARIIGQVALALNAAHKVGLLHRDVKPSNVLLDENDFAYLIDFGIARAADETRLTKSGNTIGTFQYIAPERLGSQTEDARADIYSLACVLYECLTGHPPFDEATMAQLMYAHVNTAPPKPSTTQPNVPAQIDPVIATGMAKDPDQRYATTIELANAARDAITVPMARAAPTPAQPPTEPPAPPAPTPAPVWQQPAYLTLDTTQHHPPSWPPVPQPRLAGQPGPWPGRHPLPPQPPQRVGPNQWLVLGVVAALVLVAALVAAGIYIATKNSNPVATSTAPTTTAPTTTAPTTTAPTTAPPVAPAPPGTANQMSGHYIETWNTKDGQSGTNDWYFTPCGDGCASVAAGGGPIGQARLVNGQWTMDYVSNDVCQGGGNVPRAISSHSTWDANTLAGTEQDTLNVPACGTSAGAQWTNNLQLRHVA
jgi:serine/threonine protein kinase